MILEFEDWHFSRSRGYNPKPYLDYFFWRLSAKLMSGAFVVNNMLASKMRPFRQRVELLPGVVPHKLVDIAKASEPFSSSLKIINVGFFGGLTAEKGAGVVMQLAATLPDNYVLHVTGSGPLAAEMESCARQYPNRLNFHGRVNDDQLYELIAGCDVMLNPHASIEEMNDGVFPFKVIEAVASGRLLISTTVPRQGLDDVLQGVLFVEHSVDSFLKAILMSRAHYLQHAVAIKNGAAMANQRFGGDAILKNVQSMLKMKDVEHVF
jgi:glycosyltransferase involved in cell wall biosynthesis